jgi:hypothetical protein
MVNPFQPDQPTRHCRNKKMREYVEPFTFHDMNPDMNPFPWRHPP